MPPSLRITIPQPCHEDWNAMTPAQQGRHCASCNKLVMDFTAMSDAQIIAYFQSAKGNTCGRFYNNQLDRDFYLYTTTAGKRTRIRYIAVSMLVAQLFAYRTYAKPDMIDTSMIHIDSCGVVSIDTATTMVKDTLSAASDSLALKWNIDSATNDFVSDTYTITCSTINGFVIMGGASPIPEDTFHEVGPWHKYISNTYIWLQQFMVGDFSFRQNIKHLSYINRKEQLIETKVPTSAHQYPKPSKRKQVLNWLATLPRRLKIIKN